MIDSQCPEWIRAADLQERARLRPVPPQGMESDAELARFRLERWQAQNPFSNDSFLERRLALDGLTLEQFSQILGEPPELLRDRTGPPPAWLAELSAAFEESGGASTALAWPDKPADPRKDFLYSVRPAIDRGRRRLLQGAQRIAASAISSGFDPEEMDALFLPILVRHLVMMVSPVMVLEMHVAGLQGQLAGNTPQERFASFIERLQQPEVALAILREYPVLARQVVLRIDQWVDCALEFLEHLTADLDEIRTLFAPDLGKLSLLEGGLGDRHQSGRSVLIAGFTSGRRIVYKPRSLAVDRHFQDLLAWMNEKARRPWFRTLKILDRGAHGWIELVEPRDCADEGEVTAFYERQGAYLALLNALQATDFHYENLIAAGEHPVLVDLEALFHPRTRGSVVTAGEKVASRAMFSSVLRVGLLPQRMFAHQESEGVDVSGLGARQGQLSPQAVPLWERAGTHEMKLVRKRMEMPEGRHRPTLSGSPVDVVSYLPAILRGFESAYDLITACREEILAPDGPLSWFEDASIRAILRPTRTYALLLQESFHPDLLRDGLDRDRHFDRLWIDVPYRPDLERVIPFEREALARGDVPLFTATPASCDLFLGPEESAPGFFETSGMELARRRLRSLGPEDLAQQAWLIRASFANLVGEREAATPSGRISGAFPSGLTNERLIAAARQIGDRIEAMALWDGDEIGWTGLKRMSEQFFGIVPLTTDLYDGLPGVALFLAYLGHIAGEQRYTRLARITLTTLRGQLERSRSNLKGVGGFEGWGGVIYLLTHLAILWDEPELLEEAEGLLADLPELVARDEAVDVINGSAGCIAALLGLHRVKPSEQTLSVALQCGDRLLARSQEQPHGIAWPTHLASTAPLTGFAHGAAGIAWALLELAAATGEERFSVAARRAIDYERSLFSPEAGNWPDLRAMKGRDDQERHFAAAWCFGATGIGLSRLASLPHLDDSEGLRTEIRVAARTTLAHGFGSNHSLCHGDFGNLDVLLQAGRELGDPDLESEGRRIAASLLDDLSERGPRCATPASVESPGLMTGLAGIGYGLLRLAAPNEVPSVLLLEPPPKLS
jgi:type 2 lantibiotic biosynthesis protein LanM